MKKELKDQYKTRIIHANRSQLIVILYEMCFSYMEDAKSDYENQQWEECKLDLDRVCAVVKRLRDDLNLDYEIAKELYVLYDFSLKELEKCRYKKSLGPMEGVRRVLNNLYAGMKEMERQDDSKPLMRHSEVITAGLTYGKNSLDEISYAAHTRGFYA